MVPACSLMSPRIVGIAGLYRTGKSFLLNRLLGAQGFQVA